MENRKELQFIIDHMSDQSIDMLLKDLQVNSISAKAELINALTNAMKVNKEHLGTYHELQNLSFDKLIAVIKSIDI